MFGQENNIVGVIMLVILLMLLRGNLGYKTKETLITIPFMFAILAFAPKLAELNFFAGFFIDFIALMLLLILSSHNLPEGNHIGFVMGYIMFKGYEVTGDAYSKRLMALLAGAVLVTVVYYFVHKKSENKRNVKDIFKELNICSTRTQWYIKLSLAVSAVTLVGNLLSFPRVMWVNLAIMSLLTPMNGDSKSRKVARIPATFLGAIAFWLVYSYLVPQEYHTILVFVLGFCSMFISDYFIKTIYNSFNALMASVVLFPYDDAIFIRLVANISGVLIAIAFNFVICKIFDVLSRKKQERLADI